MSLYVSLCYVAINACLALIIFIRSRRNRLSKFYVFCVAILSVLLTLGYLLEQSIPGIPPRVLGQVCDFIFSLFPFFFIHFMTAFARSYEIFKSKRIVITNYSVGLLCYGLVLLDLIPSPFSEFGGISGTGYLYMTTWMSIMFTIGVAQLYSLIGGFTEKGISSNTLFVSLVVLTLILPTPFTVSIFSVFTHGDFVWHFVSSTVSLAIVIFVVFRHRITMNTPYQTMKAALEAMNDLLIKTDLDFRISMARGGILQDLGYEEKDLLGHPLTKFLVSPYLLEHYSVNGNPQEMNHLLMDADLVSRNGSITSVEFSFTPVVANEEVVGFVGVARDITRRKRAEETARQSEAKYREFFEQDFIGLVTASHTGQILTCNPAFVHIFGFSSVEEAMSGNIRSIFTHSTDYQTLLGQIKKLKRLEKNDVDLRHLSGSPIHATLDVIGVFKSKGELDQLRVYIVDNTERKELEDQLRQAQKMENLGVLAGGIAHDFNNILGILSLNAEILRKSGPGSDRHGKAFDALRGGIRRGASLVSQLLTFARRQEVVLEPTDVNAVVKDTVSMLQAAFPKTITFSLELCDNPPIVNADANQLHQLVLNLCVNARDAMPGGGTVTITTETISDRSALSKFNNVRAGEYIVLRVSDTGHGMDESTRARIFEPFFTTKGPGKGTGLGLAVVYGVVKSQGGFIDVESTVGVGTTFTIYMELLPPDKLVDDDLPLEVEHKTNGTETILLVEDEEILRESLKGVLEEQGYTIIEAEDGDQAVELYRSGKNRIDIVLTDIGLPKRNGWDAFLRMREINPRVRGIFASGNIEPEMSAAMEESGERNIIRKPYVSTEVLLKIREVADNSEPATNKFDLQVGGSRG